jgi:NAD(P)-dependent dehydrogenase (short-subunit alcohol dehydrogenase family)
MAQLAQSKTSANLTNVLLTRKVYLLPHHIKDYHASMTLISILHKDGHLMSNTKIALVTSGTSGIGLSLLLVLIEAGFSVHFIGRYAEKGQQIKSELKAAHHSGVPCFVQLDLSNLGNVAGLMLLLEHQVTNEGFQKTFTIGYLSACILCHKLTSSLAKAANLQIVNVAGMPTFVLMQWLDLDDLGFEKKYNVMDSAMKTVHSNTVLMEIIVSKQLWDQGITVNSFQPDAVQEGVSAGACISQ